MLLAIYVRTGYTWIAMSKNQDLTPENENPIENERFFHETQLLYLEGLYFSFNPKQASKNTGQLELFSDRLKDPKNIEAQPVIVQPNPEYGQPSVLAYKVFTAILKIISDHGDTVPDRVGFSFRELARLVGRSKFGGKDVKEIMFALRQLNRTFIVCTLYDRTTKTYNHVEFPLITDIAFAATKQKVETVMASLHPTVLSNLQNKNFFCLNYSRLETLEPIGMALYKNIFFYFSSIYGHKLKSKAEKPKNFTFHKKYTDICSQWLGGIKILTQKSRIQNEQLGRHLDDLIATKLISKWTIEPNKLKDDFILEVFPAIGFFEDYNAYYRSNKVLKKSPADDTAPLADALSLVHYFFNLLHGDYDSFEKVHETEGDVSYAKELLEKHSLDTLKKLVDYAVKEAEKTKFAMATFRGIKIYVAAYFTKQAEIDAKAEKKTKQSQKQSAEALQDEYENWKTQKITTLLSSLSKEEVTTRRATILDELLSKPENKTKSKDDTFLQSGITIFLRSQIAKENNLPAFEEWIQSNQK